MNEPIYRARRLVAGALLAMALGLAACGGSSKDEQAVRKRVNGFYSALAAKDPAGVCASLSGGLKGALTRTRSGARGPRSCEAAMRFNFLLSPNLFRNAGKAKVEDVKVKGDQAAATISYRGRKRQFGLSREHGRWLITTLRLKGL